MWEREMEIKDIKDQLVELVKLLNESEAQKLILLKEQKMREQAVAIALAASSSTVVTIHLISRLIMQYYIALANLNNTCL
ncbi:unnamed protein product [Linum tenue]|uniref:Uncharacterized protein n=1 Tax=Linum tenue TaxID=586396 RepID=A0AAV0JB66_9ROSI|nr:unnamed protein product [Linum tenue]